MFRCSWLLLILATASAFAPTVQLDACNAGTADIDLILSQSGRVKTTHIAPADCAMLAETKGAMAQALFGFAFADAHGKWGSARRLDVLPGWKGVARVSQNITVAHNSAQVPVTLQLQLTPRVPVCHTEVTSAPSNVAQLPLGASPAQVRRAQAMDVGNSGHTSVDTYCDNIGYTLNVVAYSDSHEIAFGTLCESCEKKAAAKMTDAERAAAQRRSDAANAAIGMMASAGPLGAAFGGLVGDAEKESARVRRLERYRFGTPQHISWTDVPRYSREAFGTPGIENKYVAVQGTIERVNLPLPGAEVPLIDAYFKESPDKGFNFCTTSPDIFRDAFGDNYATSMVGKTVEVQGEVTRNTCQSGAGIRVTLSHQIKFVGAGAGMVASIAPPPYKFPPPVQQSVQRPYYDPSISTYNPDPYAAIDHFCNTMYNPTGALPGDLNKIEFENRNAIAKEVGQCKAYFDPTELNKHRKLAMRYCLGHYNYLASSTSGSLMKPFDDCIAANDTLLAMCNRTVFFRSVLAQAANPYGSSCGSPRPNNREYLIIKQGGFPEFANGFVPDTAPGIPTDLFTSLEPGIIQKNAPPPRAAAAPAPQPPQPGAPASAPAAKPNPVSAAQQQAETRARLARMAACRQQAAKDYPRGGKELVDALRACTQTK